MRILLQRMLENVRRTSWSKNEIESQEKDMMEVEVQPEVSPTSQNIDASHALIQSLGVMGGAKPSFSSIIIGEHFRPWR
jgi:hypothetical protein